MTLTTVAEVRALVETDLDDTDLQDVIEREEAWLARRIGPLTGPRTVVYHGARPAEVLALSRPAATVTVSDLSGAVVPTLIDGRLIDPSPHLWLEPVTVTWTPDDRLEVIRAVIELVRLVVTGMDNLAGETMGSYSYQKFGAAGSSGRVIMSRAAILRSLRPQPTVVSVALTR